MLSKTNIISRLLLYTPSPITPQDILGPALPELPAKLSGCSCMTMLRSNMLETFPSSRLMALSTTIMFVIPVDFVDRIFPRSPTCRVLESGLP